MTTLCVKTLVADLDLWPDDGWTMLDDRNQYRVVSEHGEPIGVVWAHIRPDRDEWCRGSALWKRRDHGSTWILVSLDPIHVEPSLLCRVCGAHGFLRAGGWTPA